MVMIKQTIKIVYFFNYKILCANWEIYGNSEVGKEKIKSKFIVHQSEH